MMNDYVFEKCHIINGLLDSNNENQAREELIKLLDYIKSAGENYSPVVNHLIRQTGLYPYLELESSLWEDRYVFELFKVDVGLPEKVTLHREQSLLLKELLDGTDIAVSAPTSFGKSFIIDAFIKLKRPDTVMILVPTIALADETRRRIQKKFSSEYKVITTTDATLENKNILIFPQERALAYLKIIEQIDILVIDEFYKASSAFDKQRSPSLIKAMLKLGRIAKQRYYLAPNISEISGNIFTENMKFLKLDFTTVFLQKHDYSKEVGKDDKLKSDKLIEILNDRNQKTLIYAGTYKNIELIATLLLETYEEHSNSLLTDFSEWLSENYSYNWLLTKIVPRGFGIHSGRLHRSLSQIQIKLFEEENGLNSIISTSSIVEGVNTSAENVIIWMNKNGRSNLNDFTYKNIIGRGGRMFKYFIGQIYLLSPPPHEENTQLDLEFPNEILGDLDKVVYDDILTKDQVAAIVYHEEEMAELIGERVYEKLKEENAFESSDTSVIKSIALDMKKNPEVWYGLYYLNSINSEQWGPILFKILSMQPGIWDTNYTTFIEFIKILKRNWFKSIPELLMELEVHEVDIERFFQFERNLTFKFSSLLKDINTLQKVIFSSRRMDISRFIYWASYAFLPAVAYQLEEYGLPRMMSKKLHANGLIDFYDKELSVYQAIDHFREIGIEGMRQQKIFTGFENYILDYFFEGITYDTSPNNA